MIELSIIIPHFNSSHLLINKLLPSIPDRPNIEIIIIDDHSNKHHLARIKQEIQKRSCNKIRLRKNLFNKKGAGSARNVGTSLATGNWILFADADDFFSDKFYEIIFPFMSSKYDIVFFEPTSYDLTTKKQSTRHIKYKKLVNNFYENQNNKNELRIRYNFFVPWSKLFNKNFIKKNKIKFDETLVSNDVMFSMKCGYFAKKINASKEIIYCVTKTENSLTMQKNELNFDIRTKCLIQRHNYLKSRLDKSEFKKLRINGVGILIDSLKYGLVKTLKTIFLLKKNNIKICNVDLMNVLKKVTKRILI